MAACSMLVATDVERSKIGTYVGSKAIVCVGGLSVGQRFPNLALQHFGLGHFLLYVGTILCSVRF